MQVFVDPESLPESVVVTTGFFDGVHKGHRQVLQTLQTVAAEKSLPSCVVSFWPHPRVVLGNAHDLKLLTDLKEKQAMLAEIGIDYLVFLTFTRDFARLDSEHFFDQYLIERIHTKHLVVGYDHHFGRDKEMDVEAIGRLAASRGVGFTEVGAFSEMGLNASSTLIRRAIENTEIEKANELLGYEYRMLGIVREGRQIGRTLGYPTANVSLSDEKLIPGNAVYGVMIDILGGGYGLLGFDGREDRKQYYGLMNIGYRPTISESTHRECEVHILKFKGNLYGKTIEIRILTKLRDEFHFSSRERLKAQIKDDVERFKRWFKKHRKDTLQKPREQ